jgi:hypothetical protein
MDALARAERRCTLEAILAGKIRNDPRNAFRVYPWSRGFDYL